MHGHVNEPGRFAHDLNFIGGFDHARVPEDLGGIQELIVWQLGGEGFVLIDCVEEKRLKLKALPKGKNLKHGTKISNNSQWSYPSRYNHIIHFYLIVIFYGILNVNVSNLEKYVSSSCHKSMVHRKAFL